MSVSIAVIGECMLELSHTNGAECEHAVPLMMRYGGDTINTSVYLARNHVDVAYVTGLSDDIMSDWLLSQWQGEGIDCALVQRLPGSVPAMYMINVDEQGERSFLYWRKNSPASRIFDSSDAVNLLFESLRQFDYVYVSGISLAILPAAGLANLFTLLSDYQNQGGRIIFDGNYRPRLWDSVAEAQAAYQRMYSITHIALPTLEDESALFGYESEQQLMSVLGDSGVAEIVIKMGGDGCLAQVDGATHYVDAELVEPVDTTAAGDSFNAGYLAARLRGEPAVTACRAGHALAAKVIQHRGAIIPMESLSGSSIAEVGCH
ncbi:ketodeoxygluconokinase [Arenicella chitinivorans]|uniref:2-dehydro-3-deoxygluconokinase n=1 Tax=Arenicella chitinivorans TaxID=1329800 RepID=A0A918VNY4_9GAMM|nr:sugar kinase [Arenicella chitinivorans]GHA11516.1 ketodeoxygluconokinase [Arenicella chitinivorans]